MSVVAGEPPYALLVAWPVMPLGALTLKIGSGATPTGGEPTYLPVRHRAALVRSQNVLERRFSEDGLAFISDAQADRLAGVALQRDDVLLNITGDGVTFGRSCIIPIDVLPACVNQHVSIIRADKNRLDAKYLLAYLTHPSVKHYIESFNAGGSRRAITKGHIKSFAVPLAPLKIQREIGEVLGLLDDKIDLNRKMNHTLEELAAAFFKSWFVDFDPVVAKRDGRMPVGMPADAVDLFPSHFEDSPLGPIPQAWRAGTLGNVATNPRSGVSPNDVGSDVPYIGLEHMPQRSICLDAWGYARQATSGKFRFKQGDFLFGKLRPYFHKVGVTFVDGVCSTDILVLNQTSHAYYAFVLGHISSREFIDYNDASSGGTRMPRTSWGVMERYQVAIPPAETANLLNEITTPLLQQLKANVEETRTLTEMRDLLAPRLLSGEITVKTAEKKVAEVV